MPENKADPKAADGTKADGGTGSPPDTSRAATSPPVPSDGQTTGKKTEAETFPRSYVEELRREAAGYRDRAKRSDVLAQRLVTAYAATTGRLVDPADLPHNDDLLGDDGMPDQAKITAAVDQLVKDKPYLASRRPAVADVGQGVRDDTTESVSIGSLLRAGVSS